MRLRFSPWLVCLLLLLWCLPLLSSRAYATPQASEVIGFQPALHASDESVHESNPAQIDAFEFMRVNKKFDRGSGTFAKPDLSSQATALDQRELSLLIFAKPLAQQLAGRQSFAIAEFPVSATSFQTIEMKAQRSVADANSIVEVNDGKSTQQIPMPAVRSYRGTIAGDAGSMVFLSLVNGSLYGAIHHADGRQFIIAPDLAGTPLPELREQYQNLETASSPGLVHKIVRSDVTLNPNPGEQALQPFVCGTTHPQHQPNGIHALKNFSDEVLEDDELLEIELALECDAGVYQLMNQDLDRQIEYIGAMYAMISNIYESEVNVTLYIKHLYIWTSAIGDDPYRDDDDIFAMLEEVRSYWRSKRSRVSRDLTQVITVNRSGNIGGVAYPGTAGDGTVCDNNFGYSLIGIYGTFNYPTPAYTWDAVSAAHELGHNFSSPHTHSCFWGPALDTCVIVNSGLDRNSQCVGETPRRAEGSIMSYCHLFDGKVRVGFLDPVARLIRVAIEKNTSDCVAAPRREHINIVAPLGDRSIYPLNQDLRIEWTSSRIAEVQILYSTDLGTTWTVIESNIAASARFYDWTVPPVLGGQETVIVRVASADNEEIFDQTWGTFGFETPEIEILRPNGGEILVVGFAEDLRWLRTSVAGVDVHLRAEGSQEWIEIAQDLDADELEWTPTEAWAGKSVRMRVRSAGLTKEPQDISEKTFLIEQALLEIVRPDADDVLLIGSQFDINWRAENLERVRIQYVDGKDTLILHPTLSAANGAFTWDIAADRIAPTQNAYIRLLGLSSGGDLEVLAGPFAVVDDPVLSVDDPNEANDGGFELQALAPNPASTLVNINFVVKTPLNALTMKVRNLQGILVLEEQIEHPAIGQHQHQIDCAALPNGAYSLVLQSELGQKTFSLVILR